MPPYEVQNDNVDFGKIMKILQKRKKRIQKNEMRNEKSVMKMGSFIKNYKQNEISV